MRILYFSYAYPNAAAPNLGSFNRSLLAAMAKQHDVRVVSPVSFVDVLRGQLRKKSPLVRAYSAIPGVSADYVPFYYPPKLFRDRFGDFLWWSVQSQLNRTIQEFQPDVILSYWAHPDGDVAVRAGRQWNIPVVTMVGGSDVLLLARHGRRREAILKVLRQADAVIAVSQNIAETLLADGLSANKVHVVRRGIDRALFCPADQLNVRQELGLKSRQFTIITVGRLVPVKGHTHLIHACAELYREGRSLACYFLGDGPLAGKLTQEIRSMHLESMVHMRGAQPQADLARWYQAADVTVLPSLSEGVPNVLLESIGCGTPFIASNVGGIPEIADLQFDTIVPRENSTALADAIRQRMIATASTNENTNPKTARRFVSGSWEDSANALCNVFRSVGVAAPQTGIPQRGEPQVNYMEKQAATSIPLADPVGCREAS